MLIILIMKEIANSLKILKKIHNKKNNKYIQQIILNLTKIQHELIIKKDNPELNRIIEDDKQLNVPSDKDNSSDTQIVESYHYDENDSDSEEVDVEVIEMDSVEVIENDHIEKIDINVSKFKGLSIDEKTTYIKKVMSKYPIYFNRILQITENEFEHWGFKFDKNLLIITYKDEDNIITRSIELSIFCKILRNDKLSKFDEKNIFTIPSMFEDEKKKLKNETNKHKKKLLSNLIV